MASVKRVARRDGQKSTSRVGVACIEVAVPIGTAMAGFIARCGPSTGTHDPVTCRAMVFDDRFGIVSVDVCALHEDTCAAVRFVAASLGLQDVVVTATHSHSGPSVGCGRVGVHEEESHSRIIDAARAALAAAVASAEPCRGDWVESRGLSIAFNRRKGRPLDVPVQAIRFSDASGRMKAVLVSFACHPVVLDASNRQVSADYPGYLRDEVERRFPESICVFVTGAAGEINTGHSAEESMTAVLAAGRTYERARQIGHRLAESVCADEGSSVQLGEAQLFTHRIAVPYTDAEEAPWVGRVSLLTLGEVAMLFLPGEPFNGWASAVPSPFPQLRTMVLGYSDGVPGYFPSVEAYAEGGYEVLGAHEYYDAPAAFSKSCSVLLGDAARMLFEEACNPSMTRRG